MIRRNKWLLGFSIVYWLIIIMGAILNIFALRKVPLETYGLRAYSFSPNVSPVYYTPGLYNIGVGYYFITFPSSKQYVLDNKVIVTNKNLEKLQVTYSFCYRYIDSDPGSTPTRYSISTRPLAMTTSNT